MTLVAARVFGERIIVMSDSLIDDPNATRINILPGRLKSVALHRDLCISYSGRAGPALAAIRQVHASFRTSDDLADAIDQLSANPFCRSGDTDFLVAARTPGPTLLRITHGRISGDRNEVFVGDPEASLELDRLIIREPEQPDGEFWSGEEVRFARAFSELVLQRRCPSLGGVVFNCLGSPNGFCYQNHAGTYIGEDPFALLSDKRRKPHFEPGLHARPRSLEEYSYSLAAHSGRGVPVVGVYFPRGRLGFVYSPLECDEAVKLIDVDLGRLNSEVQRLGDSLTRQVAQ